MASAQTPPEAAGETQVLVVGTVHQQHRRNPNYDYEDVVRILEAFQPQVVCVEIRPEVFRREPYLKEMMLGTVWALAQGGEVCGFDWFNTEVNTRALRAELENTPEYQQKAQTYDSLVATNHIRTAFDQAHGDFWRGSMDYRFYNGPSYNRYIEEGYRLSLAVYGDDPDNLFYESRNRRMMDLAWEVISRHPGQRVALLTGAEHKHYFDRDLRAREGVTVVDLEEVLPLGTEPLHPAAVAPTASCSPELGKDLSCSSRAATPKTPHDRRHTTTVPTTSWSGVDSTRSTSRPKSRAKAPGAVGSAPILSPPLSPRRPW